MFESIHPSMTTSFAPPPGAGVAVSWRQLTDFAVFFPGTLAESVLELDAHCRRKERETGLSHPVVSCDELGAGYLSFTFQSAELDPEREGFELFRRLAGRDRRVANVDCVGVGEGFARFRIRYQAS